MQVLQLQQSRDIKMGLGGGLKLNGTHQLLPYVDEVNILGDNIDTIKKNTNTITDASQ
jgi:hypothetical protein